MMTEGSQQHEFQPTDDAVFQKLATRMRGVGFWFEVYGFLMIALFAIRLIPRNGGFTIAPFDLVTGTVFLLLGHWTRRGAREFRRVVETKGSDITHLMAALGEVSKLYGLLDRLILIAVVLT